MSSQGVPVGVGDWNKVMKRGKGKEESKYTGNRESERGKTQQMVCY